MKKTLLTLGFLLIASTTFAGSEVTLGTFRISTDANTVGLSTSANTVKLGTTDNSIQFTDDSGTAYGIKHVGNKPRVSSMPYLYDIAEGNVANHLATHILGHNNDVDNAVEDIWEVGGTYVFPTAAMQMEVRSSSGNDTSAGTGAQTVMIHYLDSGYDEQTEIVTLNGTGVVNTVATDIIRINQFHVQTAGSGGQAAGDIDVRHLTDTPAYARIGTGSNRSHQAIWTVPDGYTAYITAWGAGVGHQTGNRYGRFELTTTSTTDAVLAAGIFQAKDTINIQDNAIHIVFSLPIKVPSRTDIKVTSVSDNANANALVSAQIELWYEK